MLCVCKKIEVDRQFIVIKLVAIFFGIYLMGKLFFDIALFIDKSTDNVMTL